MTTSPQEVTIPRTLAAYRQANSHYAASLPGSPYADFTRLIEEAQIDGFDVLAAHRGPMVTYYPLTTRGRTVCRAIANTTSQWESIIEAERNQG